MVVKSRFWQGSTKLEQIRARDRIVSQSCPSTSSSKMASMMSKGSSATIVSRDTRGSQMWVLVSKYGLERVSSKHFRQVAHHLPKIHQPPIIAPRRPSLKLTTSGCSAGFFTKCVWRGTGMGLLGALAMRFEPRENGGGWGLTKA